MSAPPTHDDEAFWKKQEARRDKRMGQPACSQSGASWTLIDIPGNFCVVVHGEYDCLNCFHHHGGRSAARFFSTRLTERQITQGHSEQVLTELLDLIAVHEKPEAVIVLGTCPVEVIGADYVETTKAAAARHGVPMIALRTHGLALLSQPQILDLLYTALVSLPPQPPVDLGWHREIALLGLDAALGPEQAAKLLDRARHLPEPGVRPRVNLLGLPTWQGRVPEPLLVLHKAGIDVNGLYPELADLQAWRAIREAGHTFALDKDMLPRLTKRLEAAGQAVHDVPMPLGVGATVAMYAAIGEATGRRAELMALVEPVAAALRARVAQASKRFRGVRLAYTARMTNTYRTATVARDGLGEVAALVELGFDVELLVQGAGESEVRTAYRDALVKHGLDLPFHLFSGPMEVRDLLARGRYHLAVVDDTARAHARALDLPALDTFGLAPYLAGVSDNLERVGRVVAERVRRAA